MRIFFTLIFLLFFTKIFSQVIELPDGSKLDCDTAHKTLDLGYCSLAILEKSQSKMDSIFNALLNKLDSLNLDDHKFRMELLEDDPEYPTEGMTDYEEIIHNLKISQSTFLKYVELEGEIVGEFMGQGRERSIHQNLEKAILYENRSKQLLDYFK